MLAPVKKIYLTQNFGENPSSYLRFGLKGHNGLDFRAFLPSGERCYQAGKSEIFAPHDGKIIENAFDASGYGYYVKIENEKEGSVLGHFAQLSSKKVGQSVTQGELIAYQGVTGNATGIHLHWGYYQKPRQRNNGYNGFINQKDLFVENTAELEPTMTISQKLFAELVGKATKYDEAVSLGKL
ncbi:MAG: M23 family metallopeptidase [bacterium]|nr:M23 family metallopeptidase [bacterium]